MKIDANGLHFKELNDRIRNAEKELTIDNCIGQRYIASGMSGYNITINGTPGNALGAYLNGCDIIVKGNAQDAVGDTMNDGTLVVHGNAGDALGYGMRGGSIYVKGNAGYRTGIHMKQYKDKKPVIVIGGQVGSFLGEYMAGGLLIVLGLDTNEAIKGHFTATGMHGGKMFLRTEQLPVDLPSQIVAQVATDEDKQEIMEHIEKYSEYFGVDISEITKDKFYVLQPNVNSPYKKLYTHN